MKLSIPWDLFLKSFRGELSNLEFAELDHWRNISQLTRNIYDEIMEDEKFREVFLSKKWEDPSLEWEKLLTVLKPPIARISFVRKYLYIATSAAAVILLFIGSYLGFWYDRSSLAKDVASNGYTYIYSPRGQRTRIILPDSTKVWLNSESSLQYAVNYNKKTREVYLKGEAFFKVTKNHAKPFMVYANEIKVKVYGTSFNIKAFPNERYIETTLIEGKLSITPEYKQDKKNSEIFLIPKEKCVYERLGDIQNLDAKNITTIPTSNAVKSNNTLKETPKVVITENVDPETEVLWKEGKLIFKNETFGELATKMERWYDIKIHFTDEKIKNYKFTGVLDKETINQAMEALKLSSEKSYSYDIVFRDVYLKSK